MRIRMTSVYPMGYGRQGPTATPMAGPNVAFTGGATKRHQRALYRRSLRSPSTPALPSNAVRCNALFGVVLPSLLLAALGWLKKALHNRIEIDSEPHNVWLQLKSLV